MRKSLLNKHRLRPQLECLEDRSVPATFTVNSTLDNLTSGDGKLTLREAITRANTRPGADAIVLPAGTFGIELKASGEDGNATGDFDIKDTLTIQGAGNGRTFVDGKQFDRVFDILGTAPNSIRVVLSGLAVRGGNVTGSGGGIRVGNADLVVRYSVVADNQASQTGGGITNRDALGTGDVTLYRTTVARNVAALNGGGVFLGGSLLTVKNSTVRHNVAGAFGGGLFVTTATLINSTVSGNVDTDGGGGINAVTATLTNCTVSGNRTEGRGGGMLGITATLTRSTVSGNMAGAEGGGISATTATLTNSTVNGNSAGTLGGAIRATTATLTRSTVSGNMAGTNGGGINAVTATLVGSTISRNAARFDGGGIYTGTATLNNCTVSDNTAEDGGGMLALTANLTSCTVSGNFAGFEGGGIRLDTGTLTNCTVVENLANTGGGLFNDSFSGVSILRNTIIALNLVRSGGSGPDLGGDVYTSLGHNLIGNITGGTGFTDGINDDIVGTSLNPIDPKLGPLANNGGPTQTHKLLAGSPAIDAGDNLVVELTDQRGRSRRRDGNGDGRSVADIGAFEK